MRGVKIIFLLSCLFVSSVVSAQRAYEPQFSIGGKSGVTLSKMAFTPGVQQTMNPGATFGVVARYTEERFFGLVGELKIEQRGWKQTFDETDFSYSRTLTYLQLPLLTHIYFGSERVKGFFNLGPSVGYMIASKASANFDYQHPETVEGLPIENRHTNQMSLPVKNRFDYGILGGAGVEFTVKKKHSVMLEARYYYGLGNIFSAKKRDEFSASRGNSIEITLGYMFRIK